MYGIVSVMAGTLSPQPAIAIDRSLEEVEPLLGQRM